MKMHHPAKLDAKAARKSKSERAQTAIRYRTPESYKQRDHLNQPQLEDWMEAESEVLEPEHTGGFRRPYYLAR